MCRLDDGKMYKNSVQQNHREACQGIKWPSGCQEQPSVGRNCVRVRTPCTPASVPLVGGIAYSARCQQGPDSGSDLQRVQMPCIAGSRSGRVGCAYWGIEVRGDAPLADMA